MSRVKRLSVPSAKRRQNYGAVTSEGTMDRYWTGCRNSIMEKDKCGAQGISNHLIG